jgi:hypothetical protein
VLHQARAIAAAPQSCASVLLDGTEDRFEQTHDVVRQTELAARAPIEDQLTLLT